MTINHRQYMRRVRNGVPAVRFRSDTQTEIRVPVHYAHIACVDERLPVSRESDGFFSFNKQVKQFRHLIVGKKIPFA